MHRAKKDYSKIAEAAKQGTMDSIDNLNDNNVQEVIDILQYLKEAGLLGKVLVSHDAGYYDPIKRRWRIFRPFTTLSKNSFQS
jgi:phosphotriesterase-related protein